MCKMTPISVRLNLKNFILMSCAVLELVRKVSRGGGEESPPGEIGLKCFFIFLFLLAFSQMTLDLHVRKKMKLKSKFFSYKMRPLWQNEYLLFLNGVSYMWDVNVIQCFHRRQ